MHDQASTLRKLVSQDDSCASATKGPRRIVLMGAKGGVGTTTVAINLAVAMRKLDRQVMLIDAAATAGDVASICDVTSERGLEDVLQSRCDWSSAAVTGPTGVALVVQQHEGRPNEQRTKQLVRKLDSGLARYEFVLMDAGVGTLCSETLLRPSDLCLVLSSHDHVSMKRSYGLIRRLSRTKDIQPRLLINGITDTSVARDMAGRLTTSSERLLGFDLQTFLINKDPLLATDLSVQRPALCVDPNAVVSQQLHRLAELLTRCDSSSHPTASLDNQQNSLNSPAVA